jgi:NADPH-dependent ferric siderophore reductase
VSDTSAQVTGLAPRVKVHHGLALRHTTVVQVGRPAPRVARITLGGPELEDLVSLGPTGHVKVYLPDPVTGELAVPMVRTDGSLHRPADGTVHVRDYTVRAHRAAGPSGPEIDIDMVLHGDGGPAASWAARAATGQPLVLAGPKSSKLVPEGVRSVLLGCDESALPAVARWLELLPQDVTVMVLAEVSTAGDESYLDDLLGARPHLDIAWLHRGESAPGTTDLLERAVRAQPPADFTWCAGEAGSLVAVRRHLRRELGLPASRVEITGYWRRGVADFDHHSPLDPKDPD